MTTVATDLLVSAATASLALSSAWSDAGLVGIISGSAVVSLLIQASAAWTKYAPPALALLGSLVQVVLSEQFTEFTWIASFGAGCSLLYAWLCRAPPSTGAVRLGALIGAAVTAADQHEPGAGRVVAWLCFAAVSASVAEAGLCASFDVPLRNPVYLGCPRDQFVVAAATLLLQSAVDALSLADDTQFAVVIGVGAVFAIAFSACVDPISPARAGFARTVAGGWAAIGSAISLARDVGGAEQADSVFVSAELFLMGLVIALGTVHLRVPQGPRPAGHQAKYPVAIACAGYWVWICALLTASRFAVQVLRQAVYPATVLLTLH